VSVKKERTRQAIKAQDVIREESKGDTAQKKSVKLIREDRDLRK